MTDPTSTEPARRKRPPTPKVAAEAATQAGTSDWKNHPVLVVGGAVVATALTCLTYFNGFALPQRTARMENSLFNANEQVEKLGADIRIEREKNKSLQKSIKGLEEKRVMLSRLLSEARTSDMFLYKTAYPNGFATVKVGMSATNVYEAYPRTAIRPNDLGYLSVDLANSPFDRATYYYDEDDERKIITHISFRFPISLGKPPSQDIVKRLTESLGEPIHIPPDYYAWPTLDEANVFVSDKDGFLIMRSGYRPGSWPTKKEEEAICKEIAKNQCPVPPEASGRQRETTAK